MKKLIIYSLLALAVSPIFSKGVYAQNWSDAADDCISEQGDCMDTVVITPEN